MVSLMVKADTFSRSISYFNPEENYIQDWIKTNNSSLGEFAQKVNYLTLTLENNGDHDHKKAKILDCLNDPKVFESALKGKGKRFYTGLTEAEIAVAQRGKRVKSLADGGSFSDEVNRRIDAGETKPNEDSFTFFKTNFGKERKQVRDAYHVRNKTLAKQAQKRG